MNLLDLPADRRANALADWFAQRGAPAYRARQVSERLFKHLCADPQRMTHLPRALREELADDLLRPSLRLAEVLRSADGTRKFRFLLEDDATIESVWIPSSDRATLCLSSQAGCPAGCTFCATAASGFRRNLRPSEIVEQWLQVVQWLRTEEPELAAVTGSPGPVTQMVFMGMGEPLFNYDALASALSWLTAPTGFAFSPRRITVSTVGVPRRIEQLVHEFPQVRLALSLHSAIDATRERIVPMNRRHNVADLRRCLDGIATHSRRVTLEMVVLAGINDSPAEALAVARFAEGRAGHVNLLPFHPFPGAPHAPTPPAAVRAFCERVQAAFSGQVTVRRSRGLDIAGACGQLALAVAQTPAVVQTPAVATPSSPAAAATGFAAR